MHTPSKVVTRTSLSPEYTALHYIDCIALSLTPILSASNTRTTVTRSNSDVVGSVPCARMFHQFLVVGLIEACKGIQELYPDVLGPGRGYGHGHGSTGSAGGTGTGAGSSSSGSNVTEAVLSAAEAHTQLQVRQ